MPKADPADIAESMGYFVLARAIRAGGDPAKVAALLERRDRTVVFPTVEAAEALRRALAAAEYGVVGPFGVAVGELWRALRGEKL